LARGRGRQDARPPQSGDRGYEIATLAHAEQADLEQAAAAAERGFRAWRDVAAFELSKIMRKAAELLRSRADAIARLLTQEESKTLVEAKSQVMAGLGCDPDPELLAHYRTHAPCIVR
jgi:succinate-semialdehyde dehydrogenase/glutarate-semialdehyde dehydrogenase